MSSALTDKRGFLRGPSTAMVIGWVMAFVGFFPFGYSSSTTSYYDPFLGTHTDYYLHFFGFTISSNEFVNEVLSQLLPVAAYIGFGLLILGAVWAVQRSRAEQVFGTYGRPMMIAGGVSFLIYGLLIPLTLQYGYNGILDYSQLVQFGGILLCAVAVLLLIPHLPLTKPSTQRVGRALVAVGTAILIYFVTTSIAAWLGANVDIFPEGVTLTLYLVSIPLMLLGMMWVERDLESRSLPQGIGLRAVRLISVGMMLIGALHLILNFGPMAVSVTFDPLLDDVLLNLYVLGVLVALAVLMVPLLSVLRHKAEVTMETVPS